MMAPDVDRLLALYCEKHVGSHEEACRWFRTIDYDIERLRILNVVELARDGKPDSPARLIRGGEQYMALFERACRGRASSDPDKYTHCGEVLYEAFVAFNLAGAQDRAEAARAALLDPKNGLTDSLPARKIVDPDVDAPERVRAEP
jgi:hypothetical protein